MRLLYTENATLKERLGQLENEGEFRTECETEINRLRTVLNEMKSREGMPNEREEIKDRIIMKLEDEIISVRL